MKIKAPLRSYEEVASLLNAGADIFYCGVIGDGVNNRNNSILHQFSSLSELQDAAGQIHSAGKQLYLTLNAIHTDMDKSLKQAEAIYEKNIADGIIVADMRLIKELNEQFPKLPVVLSCLAGINNSKSLEVYLQPNVIGYCFERNISFENMEAIMRQHKNLNASAFVSGNCNNTQLICQLHNLKTQIPIYKQEGGYGDLICENWYYENSAANDTLKMELLNTINKCSLCALYRLRKMGVYSIKIEGRGLDLAYKLQKVRYYKAALDLLDRYTDRNEYIANCKELFHREYGRTCCVYDCFYTDNNIR